MGKSNRDFRVTRVSMAENRVYVWITDDYGLSLGGEYFIEDEEFSFDPVINMFNEDFKEAVKVFMITKLFHYADMNDIGDTNV